MEKEFVPVAFDMFKRYHSREEYSGTGMGLAICKRIVQKHGGSIWIESEIDKGSTFYIKIPAVAQH